MTRVARGRGTAGSVAVGASVTGTKASASEGRGTARGSGGGELCRNSRSIAPVREDDDVTHSLVTNTERASRRGPFGYNLTRGCSREVAVLLTGPLALVKGSQSGPDHRGPPAMLRGARFARLEGGVLARHPAPARSCTLAAVSPRMSHSLRLCFRYFASENRKSLDRTAKKSPGKNLLSLVLIRICCKTGS